MKATVVPIDIFRYDRADVAAVTMATRCKSYFGNYPVTSPATFMCHWLTDRHFHLNENRPTAGSVNRSTLTDQLRFVRSDVEQKLHN